MQNMKFLLAAAAVASLATIPVGSGAPSLGGVAFAGPGGGGAGGGGGPGGGGPGGGGPGGGGPAGAGAENGVGYGADNGRGAPSSSASSHGHGMATASAAVDPNTTGLSKAAAVLGTTPANEQALKSVTANQERQANEEETTDTTEGTTAEDSDMSLGEAVNNMSRDVRGALSELFGSRTE